MSDNTDLRIGQKYGRWTIIEDTGKLNRWREKIYKARSDYGEEMIVWLSHIKYGGSGYPVNQLNNQLKRKKVKKKIHKRKISISTTAITKEKLEVPTLTTSKWSIKYNRCVKCGGTEYPHKGNGLCQRCYEKRARRRDTSHIKRDKRRSSAFSKKVILKSLTEEVLKKEYSVLGKSLIDIAREYNCTRQYIHKLLNKYGIVRRTKSEARKIAIERKKLKFEKEVDGQLETVYLGDWTVNRDFFKTWTPQMAYVLGFIYADGSLDAGKKNSKTKTTIASPRCSISQNSPEILEKIKVLMSYNRKLYKAKNWPRGYLYRLDLTDEEMYEDLLKIGLTPAKSLNVKFPEMPTECICHFIRGCWDGDGSVYFEKGRPGEIRASFVSGSEQFIKRIVLELYKIGIERQRISYTKPSEFGLPGSKITIYKYKDRNGYYIKLQGKNCQRLFHYFYDEVDESLYLKRKYEVFKKGLDLLKKKL